MNDFTPKGDESGKSSSKILKRYTTTIVKKKQSVDITNPQVVSTGKFDGVGLRKIRERTTFRKN